MQTFAKSESFLCNQYLRQGVIGEPAVCKFGEEYFSTIASANGFVHISLRYVDVFKLE